MTVGQQKLQHARLVNSVQMHRKCTPTCLRKDKRTGKTVCRFHFPRKLQDKTVLSFEPSSQTKNGEIFYTVRMSSKRNDPLVNGYVPLFLDEWRANIDVQLVLCARACAAYIAGYIAKSEKASTEACSVFKTLMHTSERIDTTRSIISKLILRINGLRDYGKPEIAHTSLGLPLFHSNVTVDSEELRDSKRLNLDRYTDTSNSNLTIRNLKECYQNRLCNSSPLYADLDLENMCFAEYAQRFWCVNGKVKERQTPPGKKHLVIKFWPYVRSHGPSAKRGLYCKFQLMKFKPWKDHPLTLIGAQPDTLSEKEELAQFQQAYEAFLADPGTVKHIPLLQDEIRKQVYYHTHTSPIFSWHGAWLAECSRIDRIVAKRGALPIEYLCVFHDGTFEWMNIPIAHSLIAALAVRT